MDQSKDNNTLYTAHFLQLPYSDRQMIEIENIDAIYEENDNLLCVPYTIANLLRFPPGHPRKNVLYIGDPVVSSVYYPAAQFHRRTFERKFSEAVRLLEALGVVSLEVKCAQGWSKDFAASLNTPAGIELATGASGSQQSRILYQAEYHGNTSCKIPNHMAWFNHEPAWQAIANGRLNHNLKRFELQVQYEDDFGVNAKVVAKFMQQLELGGKFEQHQQTTWIIAGAFG
ncbi:MAG: hypothetical protein AB4911_22985 [Oscillochloridaceae bacterium umkhey_bin13]